MRIRKARGRDLKQLTALSQSLLDYHACFFPKLKSAREIAKSQRKFFAKQMRSKKALILVAEDGSKLVAYAMVEVKKKPPVFRDRTTAYVDAVFVSSAYRRKGAAKLLLKAMEKWAKKKGARELELKCVTKNKAALAAYGKLGFREEAKIMAKTLRPQK
ncbi:MAG: GNAT family N-acetyltransferase [Candidatus Micrarchaeota archaeon]